MNKQDNSRTNSVLIRQKAEKLMKKKPSGITSQPSEADVRKLIHELEVYQVELEIQNEELKRIKDNEVEFANNKYIELYDSSPSGYFTLSKTDTIIDLNLTGAEMLGDERSNLRNCRFGFFVSSDSKRNFSRFLENIFSDRTKESCEVTLKIENNLPKYVHLTGIASANNEQCFVTAVDLTERMKAEITLTNALIESERFRETLDHVSSYIYMKDTQSRYTYANRSTLDLFGCSLEELVGCDDTRFFPPETVKRLQEVDARVFRGEKTVEEIDVSDPVNGRRVFWEIKNPLLGYSENNEIIGLLGISTDITERKSAEEEIIHKNEELKKTNAEKDKFFSIIAHDLRSPFNSFLGLTQYMAEESKDLTPEVIQRFAVTMKDSATNLYNLLENLLHWARMQQGLIPFNPDFIELISVFEESLLSIREPAKVKGIEFAINIPDHMKVFADRNMLLTVIRNLVSNAVKFTPVGGKMTISATLTSKKTIQISIQDTGIGMDQNMIDNLFLLNSQTNRNGTAGEPSTGLGLLLSKEFTENNGGKIWVESEVGKGSTFYFTIPVEEIKR